MQTETRQDAAPSATAVATSTGQGSRGGRPKGAKDLKPRKRKLRYQPEGPRILKITSTDSVFYWLDAGTGAEAKFLDTCKCIRRRMQAIEEVLQREHSLAVAELSGWAAPEGAELYFREVSMGCWVTHRGDICVQEFENGTWVRVPGKSTGRGPYGDAIRYEPSLSLGLKWAMHYIRTTPRRHQ